MILLDASFGRLAESSSAERSIGELVQVHRKVLVAPRTDHPRREVALRSVSAEAGV